MHPLLIIDLQNGFINQYTNHLPHKIIDLQLKYNLVIATQFINPPQSNFRKLLPWNQFSEGDPTTHLAANLPDHAIIIKKYNYSCLNEAFLSVIQKHNVFAIDICGVDTEGCVLKSALDLFEIGITPNVLTNYCASSGGKSYHQAGVKILKRLIGEKQVQ